MANGYLTPLKSPNSFNLGLRHLSLPAKQEAACVRVSHKCCDISEAELERFHEEHECLDRLTSFRGLELLLSSPRRLRQFDLTSASTSNSLSISMICGLRQPNFPEQRAPRNIAHFPQNKAHLNLILLLDREQ